MLMCLFAAILVPIEPELMGLRLDPYRLVTIASLIYLSFQYTRATQSSSRFSDFLVALFSIWIILILVFHHGAERLPYAVLLAMELAGGYLIGRCCVRDCSDIKYFSFLGFGTVAFLLPFALFEMLTATSPLRSALGLLGPVEGAFFAQREGLTRAQSVFPHSILFGVYCTLFFATSAVLFSGTLKTLLSGFIVLLATFTALSSAALLSIGVQLGLYIWGWITRGRWTVLAVLIGSVALFLELASNRGPVVIMIESLTLNPRTAWWRVHIFNYGMQSVENHPLLGIGLNEWVRPYWLASTVDNYWLLTAMRYGIPGFFLQALLFAAIFWSAARARDLDPIFSRFRCAYLFSLTALILVLCTVFVWDALMVVIMVFLGAGRAFEMQSVLFGNRGENSPIGNMRLAKVPKKSGAPKFMYTRFGAPRHRK